MHVGKGSSASATVEQVLQMESLQFLKLSWIPEYRLWTHFLQLEGEHKKTILKILSNIEDNQAYSDPWHSQNIIQVFSMIFGDIQVYWCKFIHTHSMQLEGRGLYRPYLENWKNVLI